MKFILSILWRHVKIFLVTFCGKQVSMRLGLSERTAIEAGIYRRENLAEIARQLGVSTKTVSKEIRQNRTLSPAPRFNGKDCRFAAECSRQFVCRNPYCSWEHWGWAIWLLIYLAFCIYGGILQRVWKCKPDFRCKQFCILSAILFLSVILIILSFRLNMRPCP